MKRIAIFAHFDKHNIIDPYVIDYLKELKKYCDIIFVSDGNLEKSETDKLKNLCFDVIYEKHGEYDFGSYKRGYQLIQNKYPEQLNKIDELLFVNDSCYLIGNFKEVFSGMEKNKDCDFWGLTDDYHDLYKDRSYYIGSYFISFRKSVFLDKIFIDFINSIKKLINRNEIVSKYEFGLSKMLMANNKKPFAFFNINKINQSIIDDYIGYSDKIIDILNKNLNIKYKKILPILDRTFNIYSVNYLHSNKFFFLLENGFPLLKRKIIQYNQFKREKLLFLWKELLHQYYPLKLENIIGHSIRIGMRTKSKNIIKGLRFFLYLLSISRFFYTKHHVINNKKYFIIKILFFRINFKIN